MRRLRKGEYDLVNISLIGHDPITGKSFDECMKEWRAEAQANDDAFAKLRWWQVLKNLRLRCRAFVLSERLGAPPGFLA
jgi:hypothetical protein